MAEWSQGSIVEAIDEGEDIALGLGAVPVLMMMNELGLGVWKKLSIGGLRRIDAVMPAMASGAPYSCEAYWADVGVFRHAD